VLRNGLNLTHFSINVTVILPDDGRHKLPKHVVEDKRMHCV